MPGSGDDAEYPVSPVVREIARQVHAADLDNRERAAPAATAVDADPGADFDADLDADLTIPHEAPGPPGRPGAMLVGAVASPSSM